MTTGEFLNPSEAANRLGVSAKALRIYEARGLMTPLRTASGWRVYGPAEMARAKEIVTLRKLKLSLAQVAEVLEGDSACLAPALDAHRKVLEGRIGELAGSLERLQSLRAGLAKGQAPAGGELEEILHPVRGLTVAFNLPWPWGGERFDLKDIQPLTYITGPLGSGKTRLARKIAETLPGATFLGLERLDHEETDARACTDVGPDLLARVERAMTWLSGEGAVASPALMTLLLHLEAEAAPPLVIDMIEQGLDQATQEALMAYLRQGRAKVRPLFMLTRSRAILDVASLGPGEAVLFCPANHSPPIEVAPYPGTAGYEALTSCLASPEVRARTEGVVALRPGQA